MAKHDTPIQTDVTRQTLLGLLSRSLFGADYNPDSTDVDYAAVYEESLYQTVALTAFGGRATAALPPDVCVRLKPLLRPFLLQNTRVFGEHTHLDAILRARDIPYCIIKGAASAAYYPEPWLRGMGDVDFYVRPDDVERTRSALLDAGFTETESDSPYHISFEYRGVKFELHHELPGLPMDGESLRGGVRDAILAMREDLIETAHRMSGPILHCIFPDAFHHGLILLLHTQQHLLTEGIGLRHLSDWAVFVGSLSPEAFESTFRERLSAIGLWRFACLLSLSSSRALGLPYAPWMGGTDADCRTADALLEDFMAGGNFGSKDPERERVYESMLLSNRNKGRGSGGGVRNGLASLNTWVRGRWPIAQKCPLILPFGWIYFAGRRAVLIVTGRKRRISLGRAVRGSRARRQLYDELALFELPAMTRKSERIKP